MPEAEAADEGEKSEEEEETMSILRARLPLRKAGDGTDDVSLMNALLRDIRLATEEPEVGCSQIRGQCRRVLEALMRHPESVKFACDLWDIALRIDHVRHCNGPARTYHLLLRILHTAQDGLMDGAPRQKYSAVSASSSSD